MLKVRGDESRMLAAPVALYVGEIMDVAAEKAAAERRVGDEGYVELARRPERLFGIAAVEERVFGLHRSQLMHPVRPADRLGSRFRKAEIAHFALLEEPFHGTDGVFDRHRRVDTMLKIEIDDLDAEAPEAGLAGFEHVLRPPIDSLARWRLDLAELSGENHTVAPTFERAADQFLIVTPAIHIGGV